MRPADFAPDLTSKQMIAPGGLAAPFAIRPCSALYFMVTRGAPVRLHRIRNDHSINISVVEAAPERFPSRPPCP